ncbi:MAG: HAD family hydrolase [Synechococcaceae cyanobacterium]|nr:HAD family hydrolase [Synechococcaceae cyanobacterium]
MSFRLNALLIGLAFALAPLQSLAAPAAAPPAPMQPAAPPSARPAALPAGAAAQDPLPSWREGPTKQALLQFVQRVAGAGSAEAVPPAERIAVFDNDGTLWSEQPFYFPFQFCADRIRAMPSPPPAWRTQEPYASALRGDVPALVRQGNGALGTLLLGCSAGLSPEAHAAEVKRWLATARHPRTGRPYDAMVFQPMVELLRLLRASGFRTYIVSAADREFMLPWTEAAYGIPPEQVIGSQLKLSYVKPPQGPPSMLRLPQAEPRIDGPGKATIIHQIIGRRPLLAFGNADIDRQMLEWTKAGAGPRLAGLIHHTDARREWAYDRLAPIGRLSVTLDQARAEGWLVVDMARDWLRIYPGEPPAR